MSTSEDDYASGGETKLGGYLAELREDPPRPSPHLPARIAKQARWQRALREPLQAIGLLFAAVTAGLSGLLGSKRGERR